jgi:hypothetical protein
LLEEKKNCLILSSFFCEYTVKKTAQAFARDHGLSFGKLINRALIEYLKLHNGDELFYHEKPIKVNAAIQKCQFGNCREKAVTLGLHKESKKEKRLCALCASLLCKDVNIKKYWVVQPY